MPLLIQRAAGEPLILPHGANLPRMGFSGMTGAESTLLRKRASFDVMLAMLRLLMTFAANLFRSRRQLEVENLLLRHQLNIALRRIGGRRQSR